MEDSRPRQGWPLAILLLIAFAAGCRRYQPVHPLDNPRIIKLPAGTSPAAGPPPNATASDPSGWSESDLVLALHEPHIWGGEDTHHARVMAFASGRVLYRIVESGQWHWYTADIGAEAVEALRVQTLADLEDTKSFSCSFATDLPSTIVMARRSKRWVVREAYALHDCLADVARPSFGASTSPSDALEPDPADPSFVRAYRRLDAVGSEPSDARWRTPRTYLIWTIDHGTYAMPGEPEPPGEAWPDDLPAGPAPASGTFLMPIDAAYEDRLRALLGTGGLVQQGGERWSVYVIRDQPGDATLRCVLYKECETRAFADPVSGLTM